MTTHTWLSLSILMLVAVGCSDEKGAASDTDATTDPTGGASAACACIDKDSYGPSSYTCPIDDACGVVKAFCDVEEGEASAACDDFGSFTVDEAVLDCTLDRLIAGTPGVVWWEIDSNGPGYSGAYIDIAEGRTGIGRSWEFLDLSGTDSPAGTAMLQDSAYFEGCKAEVDAEARFVCFRNWWTAPPSAECDGAGMVDDF